MKTPQLSKDDVKHLADLSALELSDAELETFRKQFDSTLEYVENMSELDTKNVEASKHLSGQNNVFFEDGTECTRKLTEEEAVQNSKKHADGYFIVDRIL